MSHLTVISRYHSSGNSCQDIYTIKMHRHTVHTYLLTYLRSWPPCWIMISNWHPFSFILFYSVIQWHERRLLPPLTGKLGRCFSAQGLTDATIHYSHFTSDLSAPFLAPGCCWTRPICSPKERKIHDFFSTWYHSTGVYFDSYLTQHNGMLYSSAFKCPLHPVNGPFVHTYIATEGAGHTSS